QTAWPCEGQRSHDVTNRVREIRTPGSVGALGGNPQSDPARISRHRISPAHASHHRGRKDTKD
ncbi:MAG: hypothetical protein ACLP53_31940, partial [Isosphaeraceae bacterium]